MMIWGLSEVSKTHVTRSEARDRSFCVQRGHSEHYYLLSKGADSHYEILRRWSAKAGPGGFGSTLQPGARLQVNGPSSETAESFCKFYSAKSIGTELSHRILPILGDLNRVNVTSDH